MKNNEYSQFETKKNNVLKMFKEVNTDEMILDYLESYGYDIKNKNTVYIVKMIKKVLFNEMMFGKGFTNGMLETNPSYLFNVFGNNCSPEIKSRIYILLKENNINDDLNVFVLNASSSIESSINNKKEENDEINIDQMSIFEFIGDNDEK